MSDAHTKHDLSSPEGIIESIKNPAALVYNDAANRQVIRNMNATKFVFHSWMPISNFGNEGMRFDVPYTTFERFIPTKITPYKTGRPEFRTVGGVTFSAPSLGTGFQPIPPSGAKNIEAMQYPPESVNYLTKAYEEYGMVCLDSLTSETEEEIRSKLMAYAVLVAYCPREILLEDVLNYFGTAQPYLNQKYRRSFDFTAEQAIETALRDNQGLPVETVAGTVHLKIAPEMESTLYQLKSEITQSVLGAHTKALDPQTGILPQTRDLMQSFRNGDKNGKAAYDKQDMWLMRQFPSFPMDSDLEKSQAQLLLAMDRTREIQTPITVAGGGNAEELSLIKTLIADVHLEREGRLEAEARAAAAQEKIEALDDRFAALEARFSQPPPPPVIESLPVVPPPAVTTPPVVPPPRRR